MKTARTTPLLILASQSPRRRYLLEQAGLRFNVMPSRIDENALPATEPVYYVKTLAEAKAKDVAVCHAGSWVIGADTVVAIGDRVLGKPDSSSEARYMLEQLSGKTHQVFTGYCIYRHDRSYLFSDTVKTDVTFKTLAPEEIDWYIHTDEPFDKAGAYAIQGLGTFLVKRINGSYTNVVGLPVCEVIEMLIKNKAIDFQVPKPAA